MSPLTELITGAKAYGWGAPIQFVSDYVSLGTTLVTSNTTTVTFSGVPSGYQLLEVRASARSSGNDASYGINFNGDGTDNNYTWQRMYYSGSDKADASTFAGQFITNGQLANGFSPALIHIYDYDNNSKYTQWNSFTGTSRNGNGDMYQLNGSWKNNSTVTSVTLTCLTQGGTSSFAPNTRISLYGLKVS